MKNSLGTTLKEELPVTSQEFLTGIRQGHERAKLAFDIYVHRLRAGIGGMAAVLGGMDVLLFTAGVGENSAEVRAAACRGLEFLGLRLSEQRNARPVSRSTYLYCGIARACSGDSGRGRLGYQQRVLETGAYSATADGVGGRVIAHIMNSMNYDWRSLNEHESCHNSARRSSP